MHQHVIPSTFIRLSIWISLYSVGIFILLLLPILKKVYLELTFFYVGVGVRVQNLHTSYIKTTVACGPHAKIGCALDR